MVYPAEVQGIADPLEACIEVEMSHRHWLGILRVRSQSEDVSL
jgi:hypothetical protein